MDVFMKRYPGSDFEVNSSNEILTTSTFTARDRSPQPSTSSSGEVIDELKNDLTASALEHLDDEILMLLGIALNEESVIGKDVHVDILARLQHIYKIGLKRAEGEGKNIRFLLIANYLKHRYSILKLNDRTSRRDFTPKMKPSSKYYILLILSVAVYFIASKIIFDKVNETSKIVIDELFHIPQGLSCCNGNFSHYDPKITTLPGLYVVSAAFVGTFFRCNTYNLRFVNLIASCLNLILLSSILKFIYGSQNKSQFKIVLQAFNLAMLPPLYFFSHVYYTDTLSLMFLLMFSALCIINKSKWLILIFGLLSVVTRQTNIVWIAMVFGHKVLDILIRSSRVFGNHYLTNVTLRKRSLISADVDSSKLKRYYGMSDVIIALKYHLSTYFTTAIQFITLSDWCVIIQQLAVVGSFVMFLYINGSIVVGDKDAHQLTLHLPQLLYFLLFYGVFGLPYVFVKFISTIKLIFHNKLNCLLLASILLAMVHYNTIIHPYLLADNRHYTFYIWNRWFGKYHYAIYATIPVYLFLLFSLYDNLKDQNCISFLLPYCISLFLALGLQRLVEIRYFLIPYIILRLRFVRPSFQTVLLEFVWYLALNAVTFYIFFTKEIIWSDFSEVQRIIW